jgi:hypothetical protein
MTSEKKSEFVDVTQRISQLQTNKRQNWNCLLIKGWVGDTEVVVVNPAGIKSLSRSIQQYYLMDKFRFDYHDD